uniref:Laminin EGF-like domain-containing protein n=2 Tax=Eptatretus burgeri TaxID=7764 RepID=A0A8C4QFI8_EPTBU
MNIFPPTITFSHYIRFCGWTKVFDLAPSLWFKLCALLLILSVVKIHGGPRGVIQTEEEGTTSSVPARDQGHYIPQQPACKCNLQGSLGPSCHQIGLNHCQCRPGIGGAKCDRCARGHCSPFPECPPCHRCFGVWDAMLDHLSGSVIQSRHRANELQSHGTSTATYHEHFTKMDGALATIKNMTPREDASRRLKSIIQARDKTRSTMNMLGEKQSNTENSLEIFLDWSNAINFDINVLNMHVEEVNQSAMSIMRAQEEVYTMGLNGAYAAEREADRYSQTMLEKASSSVAQSVAHREQSQHKITQRGLRAQAHITRHEKDIQQTILHIESMDTQNLWDKLLADEHSIVLLADKALRKALQTQNELGKQDKETETLMQKLREALKTLDRLQHNSSMAGERSLATLKEGRGSISHAKDLLKDVTAVLKDPLVPLQTVAQLCERVLAISMSTALPELEYIRLHYRDIDNALNIPATELKAISILKEGAENARKMVNGVQESSQELSRDLHEAQQALEAAKIKGNNVKVVLDGLEQQLHQTESVLEEVQTQNGKEEWQITKLETGIEELQEDGAWLKMLAGNARDTSAKAKTEAAHSIQMVAELSDKLANMSSVDGTGVLSEEGGTSQEVTARIQGLKNEASSFVIGLRQWLNDLEEKHLKVKQMASRTTNLGGPVEWESLEERAHQLQNSITNHMHIYMACQD